ncbi:MAG TPA: hypothetical protein VGL72_02345 [Bryobacteraceae bacterium]
MSAFTADRYRVAAVPGAEFQLINPAHGFDAHFSANAATMDLQGRSAWLSFTAIGWDGRLKTPGPVTGIAASGSRLNRTYAAGIRESFINSPQGLEQTFVIDKRHAAGPLSLHLEFIHDGIPLEYSGIKAWDARGTLVTARLSAQAAEITLEVGDAGTLYPLTIDSLFIRRAGISPAAEDTPAIPFALSADEKTALVASLVPAPDNRAFTGTVYVYTSNQAVWTQQAELRSADWIAADGFGASLALSSDGSRALVGAPDKTVGRNRWQGSAYVFVREGDAWRQEQKLTGADNVENDVFGYSVALARDGRTALVGAAYKTIGTQTQQGAAYVFSRESAGWKQQTELRAYDGAVNAQFGASVALSDDGTAAMVGTGKVTAGNTRPESTYEFIRRDASWTPKPERVVNLPAAPPTPFVSAPYKTMLASAPPGAVCLPSTTQAAATLAFASQPTDGSIGVPLSPIIVQVHDASGSLVTASTAIVTLTSSPNGASATLAADSGTVIFSGLAFNVAGTYTLTASSPGIASVTSQAFTISAGTSSRLEFTPQPASASAGTPLGAIVVQIQDASGNLVPSSSAAVTLTSIPAGLNATVTATNGVAVFNGLSLASPGTYSLVASAPGLPSTTSSSFTCLMIANRAGVFRNNVAFLEDTNGDGLYNAGVDRFIPSFTGPGGFIPGDLPVVGDWTGDGHAKAGIYRAGAWYLDANNNGVFDSGDFTYTFGGLAGDVPFVGDWLGLGKSCVGVYRASGSFWLLDLNCNGSFDNTPTDAFFPFGGLPGDVPVVGAWTGTTTRVGVVRKYAPAGVPQGNPFFWVLDAGAANAGNLPVNHPASANAFAFGGLTGDVYVTGDWNNTGISQAGVYRTGYWVLDASPPTSATTLHQPGLTFGYGGLPGDIPVIGKW